MSRIVQLHLDVLDCLKNIKQDGDVLFKYFNIWDNQMDENILGKGYSFRRPACFFELDLGQPKMLGAKMTSYPDAVCRFHLFHELLDGRNDTMERNLPVFEVRDLTKTALLNSNISNCSNLICIEEELDYKHDNVYKYILGFRTNFKDDAGSIYAQDSGKTWDFLKNVINEFNITVDYYILPDELED
jgi:hypothetical protein